MSNQRYYIPMTAINFGLCVDQGIICPPAFWEEMKLNFHRDGTEIFSRFVIAAEKPFHLCGLNWSDEQSDSTKKKIEELENRVKEDLSENRKEKIRDQISSIKNEEMNFPLLVEFKSEVYNGKIVKLDHDGKEDLLNLFAITSPIALDKEIRVYIPGKNTLDSLKKFLSLIDDNFPFEFVTMPNIGNQLSVGQLKQLNTDGINDSLDEISLLNSFLGVSNLLALGSRFQQWKPGKGHISIGASIDLIIKSRFGLTSQEDLVSSYSEFLAHEGFRDIENDKPLVIFEQTKSTLKQLAKGLTKTESLCKDGEKKNRQTELFDANVKSAKIDNHKHGAVDESELEINNIHDLAFDLVTEKCFKETPTSSSPTELLRNVGNELLELCKNRVEDEKNTGSKYSKAFGALEDILGGMGDVGQLFSEKSKDFIALRGGALFAIRPKISEYLNWPVNERPGAATVDDYFTGILFLGLYNGFCSLGPALKKEWRPFAKLALQKDLPISLELKSNWFKDGNKVLGDLTMNYAECSTSIQLQADTNALLNDFLSKFILCSTSDKSLNKKHEKFLEALAEELQLGEEYQMQFSNLSEKESKSFAQSGKLVIPIKSFTYRSWNWDRIIDWLRSTPPDLPPVATVRFLSQKLGHPTPEISNIEPFDENRNKFHKIIKSLKEKLVAEKGFNKSEENLMAILEKELSFDSHNFLQFTNINIVDLPKYFRSGKLAVPITSFRKKELDLKALLEAIEKNPSSLISSDVKSILNKI